MSDTMSMFAACMLASMATFALLATAKARQPHGTDALTPHAPPKAQPPPPPHDPPVSSTRQADRVPL